MEMRNFSDFCTALLECGFSMGGGNAKGIFALIPYSWSDPVNDDAPLKWYSDDPEIDPAAWRMRVLEERDDIAYAKLFFRTSGYLTKEWYPYFYAVRRNGTTLDEAYEAGAVSETAKRIYEIVLENAENGAALHEIKREGGFRREDNARFDRAMIDLQMRMFITTCGSRQKRNRFGEGYGWSSAVFTTAEHFWEQRGFILPKYDPAESYEKIKAQIFKLNPDAELKTIKKFIQG